MFTKEEYKTLEECGIGNFILEEFINDGGQAVIFKARSMRPYFTGVFALKIFGLSNTASSPTSIEIESAKNDVRIASSISHKSVIKYQTPDEGVIDFMGEERQVICIPMDYTDLGSCDGESPFKDKNGNLDEPDYKAIVSLLEGLGELHNKQIYHEDIKPANILKFPDKEDGKAVVKLVITDFGISKMYSAFATGQSGMTGATFQFMAPEQLDHAHTEKLDIYSMGATLFYLITGELPIRVNGYQRDIHLIWQEAHKTHLRPNPRNYAKECHPRLALLIMKMMSVLPENRPNVEQCISEIRKIIEIEKDRKLNNHKLSPKLEEVLSKSTNLPILYTSDFSGVFKPDVHMRCNLSYFVFQVEMKHPVYIQYRSLIEKLVNYFSESFSLYETWGQKDAIILVWSSPEKVRKFRDAFKGILFGSKLTIHLASKIHHLPSQEFTPINEPHLVNAIAIQEHSKLQGLTDQIIEEYVYRYFPTDVPDSSVRAFTFVEPADNAGEFRSLIVSNVNETIEKLVKEIDPKDNERRIRKARVIEFDKDQEFELNKESKENKICVVDYVAKDYRFLVDVPTQIIEEIGDNAVKTTTFLETRRVIFQSDKIIF